MNLYHLKILFKEALFFKFIKYLAIKFHFNRCAFFKSEKKNREQPLCTTITGKKRNPLLYNMVAKYNPKIKNKKQKSFFLAK